MTGARVAAATLSIAAAAALACLVRRAAREPFVSPPGRTLVLMYSTPNIMSYAGLAEKINRAYCRRHGYAFKHVIGSDADESIMRAVWKKAFLARDELQHHDVVFWIDSDAIFNDHQRALPLDGPEEFLICSDWPNGPSLVNTGTFAVKNSAFGRKFMNSWCSLMTKAGSSYNLKFPFEQQACEDLIRSLSPEDAAKVRIAPAEHMNSVFGNVSRGNFDGLFVVHLMACPASYRTKVFRRWLQLNRVP